MIFHHRILIRTDVRAETPQQRGQISQFFLPATCTLSDQHADMHTSPDGCRNFIDDAQIVASKHRQDEFPFRGTHELQYRVAPPGGIDNEPVCSWLSAQITAPKRCLRDFERTESCMQLQLQTGRWNMASANRLRLDRIIGWDRRKPPDGSGWTR